ncbi:MAG: exodeoxyribonuclease V subunit gamma [Clostridia bacterium]|nr:exodeoxyribonuclease V subunit gamma [Clostridia bacterium]
MLHRIIGASGSGKTKYMFDRLDEALKRGKQCYVIVPEQQSVSYESALCEKFGDGVNLLCEVLNFERLPNRVARDYGGLCVNTIDKGGACALLSLVSESLKDELTEYSAVATDSDFAISLYSLISRMKMALITPQMILEALKNGILEDDERIKKKLTDIALIYSEYEKRFNDELKDPRDALTRLAQELKNKPFFADTVVFIDNYYTFTEQEYEIIKQIIAQSKDVYISFTVDYNRSVFEENRKASERVLTLARNISDDFYTGESKRSKLESLKYIEKNIWESNVEPNNIDDGAIKLINAKNRFDEVEAAASEICTLVRQGYRYKDITVIASNASNYASLVDSVFARADIPVYTSAKEDLTAKPLFAFLLASISVVIEDFSLKSIKRYVKSGYTDLTVSESDALLSYARAWKLRGKAWYGDSEWTLDPEGYREGDLTARGARLLKKANAARDKIVPALSALRDTLTQKDLTVSVAMKALYSHLISLGADERLRKNAERYLKNGDREQSEREIQLWKILINIIDQLVDLAGDWVITPKRLQSLIKLMCDCVGLGAIPASADSVTFGDASLIRANGSKAVIVLGVCDGEFPAACRTGGFFNSDEAVSLEGIGLQLADTLDKQLNTNRFLVYAALSSPSERLVLLAPRSEISGGELRQSTAWLSLERMLPSVAKNAIEFNSDTAIYSRESVAANFPLLSESPLRDEIEKALADNSQPFFADTPLVCDKNSKIDFKEEMLHLSPSKFENYANCPFSFFGNYLLKLEEKKINEFSSSEIGNFVHKMLEMFLRECTSSGKFIPPSEAERKEIIERLSNDYLNFVLGPAAACDKQFMHTYKNMVKTVSFAAESLAKEFEKSDFTPSGFEYKIGLANEDIPAIEYDVNGKRVFLRGSIDRVDTYEADGKKYVRVVDYKTYDKDFVAEKVKYGLDTQLLHYIYAYCEKNGTIPAGVFYYGVTLPNINITGRETQEELQKEIAKTVKRSGILIDDIDVVRAMSNDFSTVPAKLSKGSKKEAPKLYTRGKSKRLYTEEDFNELKQSLGDGLKSIASDVFCGRMDIAPLNPEDVKAEPCKYCKLGDLCRNKQTETEEIDDAED